VRARRRPGESGAGFCYEPTTVAAPETQGGAALTVSGLTVHYGKRIAVDDLSLTVEPGEIVALLGPNGAGKSTSLMAIAGALMPSSGEIFVGGAEVSRQPLEARARVGFADQPPSLYEFFTVAEHLAFIGEARGDTDTEAQRQLLADLGLSNIADRLCRELSFGMRQRVGLAAALVGEVSVVLLDETLNGLDPRAARAAREVLERTAAGGAAILMSTHLLGVAERLCGRILIMDRGKLATDVRGAELEALLAGGAGAVEELYLRHVVDEQTA
jgi:ABC-2 type transport system ATP-binding protein